MSAGAISTILTEIGSHPTFSSPLLAVLFFAAIASLPLVCWRFSLRTLLIATTLVALVLGMIVYVTRQ
jgi:hypothetical protein